MNTMKKRFLVAALLIGTVTLSACSKKEESKQAEVKTQENVSANEKNEKSFSGNGKSVKSVYTKLTLSKNEKVTPELLQKHYWIQDIDSSGSDSLCIIGFNKDFEVQFEYNASTGKLEKLQGMVTNYKLEDSILSNQMKTPTMTLNSKWLIQIENKKLRMTPKGDFGANRPVSFTLTPVKIKNSEELDKSLENTKDASFKLGKENQIYGHLTTKGLTSKEGVDYYNQDKSIRYSVIDGTIRIIEVKLPKKMTREEVEKEAKKYMESDAIFLKKGLYDSEIFFSKKLGQLYSLEGIQDGKENDSYILSAEFGN